MSGEESAAQRAERLRASWVANATAWTEAVRTQAIPSRRAGTDAAIVDAMARLPIGRVLDVGCGEGWLARVLADAGHAVAGIDASAPLIEAARGAAAGVGAAVPPHFAVCPFTELAGRGTALGGPFDAAVCNFALLDADVATALRAIHAVLVPGASLFIQTVHPLAAAGTAYEDGWREETFAGFGGDFLSSMPWYFRTLGSWVSELTGAGFQLRSVEEPRAAGQPLPLSLLLIATRG
jgi:2-polyprenyl-3-methyl-5-hydroxy-6-metoxy-1,4-benzoquinol methylase